MRFIRLVIISYHHIYEFAIEPLLHFVYIMVPNAAAAKSMLSYAFVLSVKKWLFRSFLNIVSTQTWRSSLPKASLQIIVLDLIQ